jgi:hypothetical protein
MKQFLTYGILDYQCMKQAGDISDNDINSDTRQAYINTKLMKIYQMLDGLNDPFYNGQMTHAVASNVEAMSILLTSGDINAIDSSALTISNKNGAFVAGQILFISMWTISTGVKLSSYVIRITTGGAIATYTVIEGAPPTLTNLIAGGAIVLSAYSAYTIDLSGTYFQRIINVHDFEYTTVSGAKIRVFDKKEDSQLFLNMDKDQLSTKRVWWYHSGDTIYLAKGSAANALGALISIEYRGKPAIYTDATIDNTIDLPPEFNQMLVDETVASYLIDRGKVVPDDINGRMANYAKAYEAAAAARAKAMEIQNK